MDAGESRLTTAKALLGMVGVCIAILTGICGLIMDFPAAIERLGQVGPAWLSNPDLWWILFMTSVTCLWVWWIFRRPAKPDFLIRFQKLWELVPPEGRPAVELLISLHQFFMGVLAVEESQLNGKYVFDSLEHIYPLRIANVLGEDAACEFIVAVASAQKAGPVIACEAAIPPVEDRLREMIDRLIAQAHGKSRAA